ncbi:MAG: hypothetical protein HY594_01205 [Candidatus Omnitrophica bacterium]|nr:hypothetical protein [Candidatus Omnitrophota bacterium]
MKNKLCLAFLLPALILAAALSFFMAGAAFAQGVPLEKVPPLPERTQLFAAERQFGYRGKVGGFALKPCKYGVFPDEKVWFPGKNGELPKHAATYFRYKKVPGIPFVGTYIIVMGDLSGYSTMTFWIKGKKGGETFEIGMNDTISNKREDAVFVGSIYRYLPRGVTPEWQQVVVPLEDFFGPDLSRVYSLVFNYNEEGGGEFWVDQLEFHNALLVDRQAEIKAQGYLLLDNFDHSDLNLLGRKTNAFKRLPSICIHTRVPEAAHYAEADGATSSGRSHGTGRGLKLDYQKEAGGWCGYYTLLNQIDGDSFDATGYKAVTFMVRGENGGESFEIGMADKNWQTIGDSVKAGSIEKYLPKGVTRQWQEVVIPLADFGKLDFSQMGSWVINFHKSGRGAVHLDDVILVKKTEQEILDEWDDE